MTNPIARHSNVTQGTANKTMPLKSGEKGYENET